MEHLSSLYSRTINDLRVLAEPFRSLWKRESELVYRMSIVTGDKRGAGTNANIYVTIHDASKKVSKILRPHQTFKDDHERGSTTFFDFGLDAGVSAPFEFIEIWRDDYGSVSLPFGLNRFFYGDADKDSAHWFLDRIEITLLDNVDRGGHQDPQDTRNGASLKDVNINGQQNPQNTRNGASLSFSIKKESESNNTALGQQDAGESKVNTQNVWVFPVHRWINSGPHYLIPLFDSVLPQDDARVQFRAEELERKKRTYVYAEKIKGGPVQVESLPSDENFSEKFFWTFVEKRTSLMVVSRFINWTTPQWSSLEDIKDIFKLCLKPPPATQWWKEDWWFGLQRLQGANPTLIKLCEAVPEKIDVPEGLPSLLEGKSLEDAVDAKKIFICDLEILEEIQCKNDKKLAVPVALFHLTSNNDLLPILIQLQQEKSENNPVYSPLDKASTWLVAKMFYNNAEAQFHQSITHLGFTHLLMEGVCAACHRSLSPSHPIFRLLAPHFLYLIAINKRGEEKLVNPGGWVDSTMTQGTKGMFQLIAKRFDEWRFEKLNPIFDAKVRGVLDPGILPYYPYRDDAIQLFYIIRRYVSKIISRYYGSSDDLMADWETQNFRAELVSPFPSGLGLAGVPGTNEEGFTSVDELIETVSCIISTCCIGHAAANAQQYDQYAFVPNYPGILSKDPPHTKEEFSDSDIDALMPSKAITLDIVVITSLLSTAITNPLGDFEVDYLYHPEDQEAIASFREELRALNVTITEKNKTRKLKYEDLLPSLVPNSISI